jgi:hypothetical protein
VYVSTYCFSTTCFQPHIFQPFVYCFQHRPFPALPTGPPTKAAYLDTVFSPDALRDWGGGSDYGDDLAVALEWITTRAKEMQQVCGVVPLGVSRVPHSLRRSSGVTRWYYNTHTKTLKPSHQVVFLFKRVVVVKLIKTTTTNGYNHHMHVV